MTRVFSLGSCPGWTAAPRTEIVLSFPRKKQKTQERALSRRTCRAAPLSLTKCGATYKRLLPRCAEMLLLRNAALTLHRDFVPSGMT